MDAPEDVNSFTKPLPIGPRIRERRLAAGMRQAALAQAAGISPSYLNLIEHDRRPIGGTLLKRLSVGLGLPVAALTDDVDTGVLDALRAAGAAHGAPLDDAADLARRHPDWAALIAAQARALAEGARTIAVLTDRAAHDPALAGALHELLTTVASVRSTASILAQTPELDRNWLGRFHANLDEESRRLAEGAEAIVAYFDRSAPAGDLDPPMGRAAPDMDDAAAADAARLPDAVVDAAGGVEGLDQSDPALAIRRYGTRAAGVGLVVCDASGTILHRRDVSGFPWPTAQGGCPLWPLYEALSRPGRPVRAALEMPDGARWMAHAATDEVAPASFDGPPVLRAAMSVARDDRGQGPARPVGPGCRLCPRAACLARNASSILGAGGGPGAGLDRTAPPGDIAAPD